MLKKLQYQNLVQTNSTTQKQCNIRDNRATCTQKIKKKFKELNKPAKTGNDKHYATE